MNFFLDFLEPLLLENVNPSVEKYCFGEIMERVENRESFFFVSDEGDVSQINLSLGVVPYDVVEKQLKQQVEFLPNITDLNQYYPSAGIADLRKCIKEYYNFPNIDDLVVTNGAVHAIDLVINSLVKTGDEVLIPDPCFPPYVNLVQAAGGIVKKYQIKIDDGTTRIDIGSIKSQISVNTKLIIINSPSNPTGHVISYNELEHIHEILQKNPHVYYLSDEVYSELIFENKKHLSISILNSHGFVVNSISKSFGLQGIRLGWIYSQLKKEMTAILRRITYSCGGVNSLAQEVAKLVFFEKNPVLKHARKNREQALHILNQHLETVEFTKAVGGFFILIKKKNLNLSSNLVKYFDGESFGESIPEYIRISFAGDRGELISGLKILLNIND